MQRDARVSTKLYLTPGSSSKKNNKGKRRQTETGGTVSVLKISKFTVPGKGQSLGHNPPTLIVE